MLVSNASLRWDFAVSIAICLLMNFCSPSDILFAFCSPRTTGNSNSPVSAVKKNSSLPVDSTPTPLSSMSSSFCGAPVLAAYDSSQLASRVSLDWVLACGLRTTGSTLTGSLTLPSTVGVCTAILADVSVVASLPVDLVLGTAWSSSLLATSPDIAVRLCDGWFSCTVRESVGDRYAVRASHGSDRSGAPLTLPSQQNSGDSAFASGLDSEGRAFAYDPPRTFASGLNSEGRAFAHDPPRTFASGFISEGLDAPVPSSSRTALDDMVQPDPPIGSPELSDFFVSPNPHLNALSGHFSVVSQLMADHGIPISGLTDLQAREALVYHLLHGMCATRSHNGAAAVRHKGSVLRPPDISLIAGILRVPLESLSSALSDARSELMGRHGVTSPILETLSGFERLRKSSLVSLAALHGLDVNSLRVASARDLIADHFARGDCGVSPNSGSIGCASVLSITSSCDDNPISNTGELSFDQYLPVASPSQEISRYLVSW
ncbi:hypothetical protein R3P38DRAFT_3572974 [Favolaschia claudopus]|uniref:Uncharacterized protein n=1 Tax=Favolaschia claudopus TaxID=2862362 RepID=A0AAW0APV2_9AGAR